MPPQLFNLGREVPKRVTKKTFHGFHVLHISLLRGAASSQESDRERYRS